MPISTYDASVPVFSQFLDSLSGVLAKAEAHAAAKKFDPTIFCQLRLVPDMLALPRQVQVATDHAKGACARLAGVEVPRYADEEKTLEELEGRLARTKLFINGLPRAAIEEGAERTVTLTLGGKLMNFPGSLYLMKFALPNFFFHASMAYAILRENGVEIGKTDFIGALPA